MSITTRSTGNALNGRNYEWKSASVTNTDSNTATDLKTITGFTTLFDTVKTATYLVIRTSGDVTFRLNKNDSDVITVGTTTPLTLENIELNKIFIGSASAVTITVMLM